jgi:hypothetical protein
MTTPEALKAAREALLEVQAFMVPPVFRGQSPEEGSIGAHVNVALAKIDAALAEQQAEATDEIEHLRADLISCRGTVKTELNHYERQAMVHGKTPHGATYEAEARRLAALLERIDDLMLPKRHVRAHE